MVATWRRGETDYKIEGGESPDEVAERQLPVIERIKQLPEETILVCMHGRALRILMCNILNLPLSDMDQFGHDNLGLYTLEYNSHGFKVLAENSTDHFS
jgi:probable phosphoglycerate mutase